MVTLNLESPNGAELDVERKAVLALEVGEAKILQGPRGEPGYTPQRGVDYWTDEDVERLEGYNSTSEQYAAVAAASAETAVNNALSSADAATAAQNAVTKATKQAAAAKDSAASASGSADVAASRAAAADSSATAATASATAAAQSAGAAQTAQTAAEAAQAAAEKARDEASEIAGGDFATKTEAQGFADTAESNAKTYANNKFLPFTGGTLTGELLLSGAAIKGSANSSSPKYKITDDKIEILARDTFAISGEINASGSLAKSRDVAAGYGALFKTKALMSNTVYTGKLSYKTSEMSKAGISDYVWALPTTDTGVDSDGNATGKSGTIALVEDIDAAIAAIPTPDVSGQIGEHNVDPASHNDIRLVVSELSTRLNALADSDDTTLDQMSELVDYIKDNRELIEQITTGKVSVSDIIDNLITNVSDKPLSAAQGVALKSLVDTAQSTANNAATEASKAQRAENVAVSAATSTALGLTDATVDNALSKLSAAALLRDSDTPKKEAGKDWTSVDTGFSSTPIVQDMVYGGGKFVGVRNSGVNCVSVDGITWEEVSSSYSLRKIAYGAGKYVALGSESSAKAYYSEDAINWTEISIPVSYPGEIVYGGGKFVILPYSGTSAAYSEDGVSWTRTTLPVYGPWEQCAYGNGMFLAVYGDGSDRGGVQITSSDGITWTAASRLSYTEYWRGVAFGDGVFVAVAQGYSILRYTEDGITWKNATVPVTANWDRVVYGDGKFIAFSVNSDKALVYKPGDASCSAVSLPTTNSGRGMAFGDNKVVIVLNSTTAAYSETVYPKELVDALGSAVDLGGVKIETGSYVGTNTYGSSNPSSLTFESQPKLVIIQESDDLCCTALFLWNSAEAPMITTESSSTYAYRLNVSYSGTTLSWYNESGAWIQLNYSGKTYSYFALL